MRLKCLRSVVDAQDNTVQSCRRTSSMNHGSSENYEGERQLEVYVRTVCCRCTGQRSAKLWINEQQEPKQHHEL